MRCHFRRRARKLITWAQQAPGWGNILWIVVVLAQKKHA
jgi:hypothetical protein